MTDKEKALEISKKYEDWWALEAPDVEKAVYDSVIDMAQWKDKQMYLLIDAIDHAYLKTDGTYGELSYEVSDKVKYLKNQIKK